MQSLPPTWTSGSSTRFGLAGTDALDERDASVCAPYAIEGQASMGTGLSSGADAVIDAMPMVIASPLASPEYRAREIRPYDASAVPGTVRRQLSAPSVVVPVAALLEEVHSLDRSGPSRSPAPVKRQISAPSFAAFAVNSRDASPRRPAESSSPTHPGFRGMSTVVDPSSFWLPQRDMVIPGMAVEAPQRPARPDIPIALPSSWIGDFQMGLASNAV